MIYARFFAALLFFGIETAFIVSLGGWSSLAILVAIQVTNMAVQKLLVPGVVR